MHPRSLLSFHKGADEQRLPRSHEQARHDPHAKNKRPSNPDLVGIYTCDALGMIQYYNNRAAELWARTPAIGDTDELFSGAFKLYRPDGSYMPHDQSLMAAVLSGMVSGIYDAEVHIERPDGSRVIVIMNISPMIDDGGEIAGAINSFYDIKDLQDTKV